MASSALATAFVNIVPGTKAMESYLKGDLSKGVGDAGTKAGTAFGNSFAGAFRKVATAATALYLTKQFTDFVGSAISSANKLYIEFEGVGSVFGTAAGQVQAFAKTAAKSAGISEAAALAAAKGFGGFASSAGLAADSAAKFSIDLTKAAGDMASFYGGGTEASLAAIKSALMGQYEPMLKYNQQLTEAKVKQEAFNMKLTESTSNALDPNARALAVQSLLMKGLGVATGDFVTYADSFDNAQQTMNANFENMKAAIGTSLLPVLGQLVAAINPVIEKAGPLLFDVFQKLIPIFDLAISAIDKMTPALDPVIGALGMLIDVVVEILKTALPPFMEIISALLPLLAPVMQVLMTIVKAVLPPLAKLISGALVPILMFLVDILNKYVLPYLDKLAGILGTGLTWAIDAFVKGFQGLVKKLEPVWAFIKPFIDGIASLMGLKPVNVKVTGLDSMERAAAARNAAGATGGIGAIDYSGINTGAVSGAKSAAAASKKIKTIIAKANKGIAKANATYNKAVEKANAKFVEDQTKIWGDYNSKVADLTSERNKENAKASKEHSANILAIQKDFNTKLADIVQQSKDRLRNAFQSVTAVDVGKTFADLGKKTIDNVLKKLQTGLDKAKGLIAATTGLANAGFSQTFIEQITAQGPDTGTAFAKAILAASPEAQAQLQTLFAETETVSAHGMDTLANTMYEKAGLATEALRSLYSQTQIDLDNALIAENLRYTEEQATILAKFNEGMTEAATKRDAALAEAEKTLTEALTAATAALNESLKAIEDEFNTALKEFKDQLSKHATAIKAIKDEIAAARAEAMKPIVITRIENVVVNTKAAGVKPFANGGFVNGPVNALIGEAGPEVVTPLKDFERMLGLDNKNNGTLNYYAAPNQSLSAEQALFQAMQRAKAVGAW